MLSPKQIGDATLRQRVSSLIEEFGFSAVADEVAGYASSGDRAHKEGMLSASKNTEEIAAALKSMTIKERKDFLETYYSHRDKWNPGRGQRIPLEVFSEWLDEHFPDRRELGLFLSDLKDLDRRAYQKIIFEGGARTDIPFNMGFPSKIEPYDHEAKVPTGAEVFDAFRRGDPSAKDLNRRRAAASYHIKKATRGQTLG